MNNVMSVSVGTLRGGFRPFVTASVTCCGIQKLSKPLVMTTSP